MDIVWTLDFTYVNKEVWVLLVMDLATKKILACYCKLDYGDSRCNITAEEVVPTIRRCRQENQLPLIIHSDRGGPFLASQALRRCPTF